MSGLIFLLLFVLMMTLSSFGEKVLLSSIDPYQLLVLRMFGMVVISVPLLLFVDGSFRIPRQSLVLGILVGLGLAGAALTFVLTLNVLPLGFSTIVGHVYIPLVVILSVVFLGERFSPVQIIGSVLMLVGLALLIA